MARFRILLTSVWNKEEDRGKKYRLFPLAKSGSNFGKFGEAKLIFDFWTFRRPVFFSINWWPPLEWGAIVNFHKVVFHFFEIQKPRRKRTGVYDSGWCKNKIHLDWNNTDWFQTENDCFWVPKFTTDLLLCSICISRFGTKWRGLPNLSLFIVHILSNIRSILFFSSKAKQKKHKIS